MGESDSFFRLRTRIQKIEFRKRLSVFSSALRDLFQPFNPRISEESIRLTEENFYLSFNCFFGFGLVSIFFIYFLLSYIYDIQYGGQ
ncbi:hypothetical protein LEP1GSC052_2019 [Leptospira kmetyi serovar Malaysia str. Bejo-Iso9]|nr:hypothetical protein LEP1GSC052_2019 [Leptospira kmetyi serovar Malaysia str. Bejo-Iso9]